MRIVDPITSRETAPAGFRAAAFLAGTALAGLLAGGCATPIVVPPITNRPDAPVLSGKFVWHDLVTPDVQGARAFYGALFGWTFEPHADGRYTVIRSGRNTIGGLAQAKSSNRTDTSAFWLNAVSVADPDAAAAAMAAAGGKVLRGPAELPERGRVAVVADPEGALLQLVRSSSGDPADEDPAINTWLWHGLLSADPAKAAAFYAASLGYKAKKETLSSGDEIQLLFGRPDDKEPRAGIAVNPFEDTAPVWVPFVRVKNAAASAKKAQGLGGAVVLEPQQTARGGWVAIIRDPAGAPVALQQWNDQPGEDR